METYKNSLQVADQFIIVNIHNGRISFKNLLWVTCRFGKLLLLFFVNLVTVNPQRMVPIASLLVIGMNYYTLLKYS